NHQFLVEEYKRPTFEVLVDTLNGAFKLGQEVAVRGTVQAFSGALLDGADIRYTVSRSSRMLYPRFTKQVRQPSSASVQVAHGTLVTDEKGRFELNFIAEVDSNQEAGFRFYNYEIQISATDRQGETQEARENLAIGDKSVVLTIPLQERIN